MSPKRPAIKDPTKISTSGLSRRQFIGGLAASGAVVTTGCDSSKVSSPSFGDLIDASDALTMSVQRMLMSNQSLAPEYTRGDISHPFPVEGTSLPEDADYQQSMAEGFQDYRLPIEGLVDTTLKLSLSEIKALPAQTQITSHSCEAGWTAIAQWKGVRLSTLLNEAGIKKEARYVCFECTDGWYDYLDLFDALHSQTILAYGMNDEPLPVQHGAPLRLRVERQLGYKSLKYIKRIWVVDRPDPVPSLGYGRIHDFAWYAGI